MKRSRSILLMIVVPLWGGAILAGHPSVKNPQRMVQLSPAIELLPDEEQEPTTSSESLTSEWKRFLFPVKRSSTTITNASAEEPASEGKISSVWKSLLQKASFESAGLPSPPAEVPQPILIPPTPVGDSVQYPCDGRMIPCDSCAEEVSPETNGAAPCIRVPHLRRLLRLD